MAIHTEKNESIGGLQKGITASAMDMILDNLQKFQYSYPIKSCVREIVCNGIDSVEEKKAARAILTGQAKVEDYFVKLEGNVYEDSHFDGTYYDPEWLDKSDIVEMHYYCGTSLKKDRVEFRDLGVGMSIKRLAGYFQLGFSTKRLSKLPLGKFGIGAKSPLATQCEYYTMESRYNGRLYRFNIYAHDVNSLIGQFNFAANTENQFDVIDNGTPNGYKVYWEPTTEKNGVLVTMETKKHHRGLYIDAVKSQLLYFQNLLIVMHHEDHREEMIDYKSPILYEDDYIILSENQYFNQPHLLINKVNYGYIDWNELELEERRGNIGIKVAPEDIDVNPSREAVLWTEKTKEKLGESYSKVVEVATAMIQEELKQDDIIKWMRTCYSVAGKFTSRNDILGRLAKIVDLSRARPRYHKDERIVYDQTALLADIYIRHVSLERQQRQNKWRNMVVRKERKNLGSDINLPIILMSKTERASNRKDKWLLQMYPNGFVAIYAPIRTREDMVLEGISEEMIEEILVRRNKRLGDKMYADEETVWGYIEQSKEVLRYDKVEVPEDFKGTEEEEETKEEVQEEVTEEEVEEIAVAKSTAEERRKLEGKTLIYTPRSLENPVIVQDTTQPIDTTTHRFPVKYHQYYDMHRMEIRISSINDWDAKEVYYAQDKEDEMLHFVAMLTRDPVPINKLGKPRRSYAVDANKWIDSKYYRLHKDEIQNTYVDFYCQHFFDAQVILVKVAKANVRLYRDFRPLQQFFIRIQNNVITMSNTLIQWNTARILREKLASAAFLYNFHSFNSDMAEKYAALCGYVDLYYRDIDDGNKPVFGLGKQSVDSLLKHLDKVREFQEFVASHPEEHLAISALAQQLFNNRQLQDGMAVEPEIMEKFNSIMDYVSAAGVMLNHMPALTGYIMMKAPLYTPGDGRYRASIDQELEHEIIGYLDQRKLLNYNTSFEEVPDEVVTQLAQEEEQLTTFIEASH